MVVQRQVRHVCEGKRKTKGFRLPRLQPTFTPLSVVQDIDVSENTTESLNFMDSCYR